MDEEDKESRIKTIEEYHQRAPRRWPLLLGYVLAALIIALVIVFGARAIYHHYHKPTVKTAPTARTTGRPGATNSTTSSSGSASSSTSGSQTANSNLPNSGPGQVVALFAISSTVAAGGHYLIKSQRQKKSL